MRLLCLADLHCSASILDYLPSALRSIKPDAIILAGDIVSRGTINYANVLLSLSDLPILAVPGNGDPSELIKILEKRNANLHLKSIYYDFNNEKINFAGFGGSTNQFNYESDFIFHDNYAYTELSKLNILNKTVLITHSPPFLDSDLDLSDFGGKLGSRSIRKIILEKKPLLNICGHVHETEGIEKLGETTILKLAPAKDGRGAILELNDDKIKKIDFVDFGDML